MKSIEDIKIELILEILQGSLTWYNIKKLSKDDELRTFMCQFEPEYAFWYAYYVDKEPRPETRIAACKDSYWAYYYACFVDKRPTEETRIAASKDPYWAEQYQEWENNV